MIEKTLAQVTEKKENKEYAVVGHSKPRVDAMDKVTGAATFVDDLHFGPALLYAKLLRSPHPHALIKHLDTSKAEALPGVRAVATGKEFNQFIGLYLQDRTLYAVDSCLVLAVEADGAEILTVEGLGKSSLDPIQRAFIEKGAVQCGYCTPGMLLSAKALLNRNPQPTDAEIKEAIEGNLCRCTGYHAIVDAIRAVAG
ncbi:MAG: 2Fe-2S iron-sulfur cluster-binding protein, partial [Bacteroidota bacterium]